VDDQLIRRHEAGGRRGTLGRGERILVLVGPDAMAASLVRAGRRPLDMMMNAPWTVAHVERPNLAPPSPGAAQKLARSLKLAEQLGARPWRSPATTWSTASWNMPAQQPDPDRGGQDRGIARSPSAQPAERPAAGDARRGDPRHHRGGGSEARDAPRAGPAAMPWLGTWRARERGAAGVVARLVDRYAESANLGMVFMLSVLVSGLAFGLWPAAAAAAAAFALQLLLPGAALSFAIGHRRTSSPSRCSSPWP
jgi:two-component system sensor histidine kinase KdpD